jgi:hypothetical protein
MRIHGLPPLQLLDPTCRLCKDPGIAKVIVIWHFPKPRNQATPKV